MTVVVNGQRSDVNLVEETPAPTRPPALEARRRWVISWPTPNSMPQMSGGGGGRH